MPLVDFAWVKAQLTRAKIRKAAGDGALELLKAWEKLDFPNDDQKNQAIDIFAKLARDHALAEETQIRWVPTRAGVMLTMGDTVRVRADAFDGEKGRTHNGRVGVVVAKRSGDIIVKHTDGIKPAFLDARYPLDALEKRV